MLITYELLINYTFVKKNDEKSGLHTYELKKFSPKINSCRKK